MSQCSLSNLWVPRSRHREFWWSTQQPNRFNKHIQTYWREIGKPTYEKYRRTTQPTIQKVSGKKMPVKLERILCVADHKLTQSIKNVDVNKVSADQALSMLKTLHSLAISVDKSADEARRWKKENTASN